MGWPTVRAILANRLSPALLDRYLARTGYRAQLTDERLSSDAPAQPPGNLFAPVPGDYGAHGRFDAEARSDDPWTATGAPLVLSGALALAGGLAWLGWRASRARRANGGA